MPEATSLDARSLSEKVGAVVEVLRIEGALGVQTVARLEALMSQFARFVERGHGVHRLEDVGSETVRTFLHAPTSEGLAPGASLQHFRRLAVRVLFRTARRLGLVEGDPSLDLVLPPRKPASLRPLESDEVDLCRAAALGSGSGLPAAAWALCEATARTGELAGIERRDVDVDRALVWISGTPRTAARWGHLTEWGTAQLHRHLSNSVADTSAPVLHGRAASGPLPQSSAVRTVSDTLTRAGLDRTSGVRPTSIAGWAGRAIFDETGRLDLAAAALGMRSLDRTARLIGWDWRASDA